MATPGDQSTNPLSEAKACLARRDFGRALEKATAAIAIAPKDAMAYLVRAEALRLLKRYDRALADLAVAIRLDPDRPAPYVVRAEILKRRCVFDQAIADATHAILLDPNNAAAYSIRAFCRRSIDDLEGASADQEELFRIDPTRPSLTSPAQTSPATTPIQDAAERFRKTIQDDGRHQIAVRENVPRPLGIASGREPLPRGRRRANRPSMPGVGLLMLATAIVAVSGSWLVFRGGREPETIPRPMSPEPLQAARPSTPPPSPASNETEASETPTPTASASAETTEAAEAPTPTTPVSVETVEAKPAPVEAKPVPVEAKPVLRDLGSFSLTKAGRSWDVVMPERFAGAEVAFYRGDPNDQTLNAAWDGHLQINGRDVVRFKGSPDKYVFLFHDYTTGMDYEEVNDYGRRGPKRLLDVTNFLHPGRNSFYFYHEQRPDLPMGVVLYTTGGVGATEPPDAPNEARSQQAAATPADEPKKGEAKSSAISVRRVALAVTEVGDCRLTVDTRDETPGIEPPQGEPALIVGLSNAKLTLEGDGTHRAVYSFDEVDSTADFASLNGSPMRLDGLSIDRAAGALILTPILIGKGPVKKSGFSFPRYLKAPLSATIEFEEFDDYPVFLTLKFSEGIFQVRVSPRHPGWQQDGCRLRADFMPIVNKRNGKVATMLEGRLEPDRIAEYGFHIPADPSLFGQRCELNIHIQGHESASIKRLDVKAKVTPSFGVALDADEGGVKVKAVIRGGASERAGLKTGDVLVSIDGGRVSDPIDTANRLDDLTTGKEIPFVVIRAGQEKSIAVKGE